MPSFTKATKQEIIDGYLNETGRNIFSASDFVDWLEGQPDHKAYPWFFGKDDAEAAREYRIGLARQMASGLRIVARIETTEQNVVQIRVREYPAYVSPMAGRKGGGGYQPFDPQDAEAMAELQRQGRAALRGWLARYSGAFAGYDLTGIEAFAHDAQEAISA